MTDHTELLARLDSYNRISELEPRAAAAIRELQAQLEAAKEANVSAAGAATVLQAQLEGSRAVNAVLRTDADQNCSRATTAESRLREVEAATIERCVEAAWRQLSNEKDRVKVMKAIRAIATEPAEAQVTGSAPLSRAEDSIGAPASAAALDEPVAWGDLTHIGGYLTINEHDAEEYSRDCYTLTPLYTAPATLGQFDQNEINTKAEALRGQTPRTDTFIRQHKNNKFASYLEPKLIAYTRQLERELSAGNAKAKALRLEGMEIAAKICNEIAAELQPYAERNYNAEDMIARQCAEAIRAEIARRRAEGEQK